MATRRFAEIAKLDFESDRLAAIDEIVNWTNPARVASTTI